MEFGAHVSQSGACVDTVRALHQTIVALRAALDRSRTEILELKSKKWPIEETDGAFRNLSADNHILRQRPSESEPVKAAQEEGKVVARRPTKKKTAAKENVRKKINDEVLPANNGVKPKKKVHRHLKRPDQGELFTNICIATEGISGSKVSKSVENLCIKKPVKDDEKKLSKSKTLTFSNVFDGDKQISVSNSFNLGSKTSSGKDRDRGGVENNRCVAEKQTKKTKNKSATRGTKKLGKTDKFGFVEEPIDNKRDLQLSATKPAAVELEQPPTESFGAQVDTLHEHTSTEFCDSKADEYNVCVEKSIELIKEVTRSPEHRKTKTTAKKEKKQAVCVPKTSDEGGAVSETKTEVQSNTTHRRETDEQIDSKTNEEGVFQTSDVDTNRLSEQVSPATDSSEYSVSDVATTQIEKSPLLGRKIESLLVNIDSENTEEKSPALTQALINSEETQEDEASLLETEHSEAQQVEEKELSEAHDRELRKPTDLQCTNTESEELITKLQGTKQLPKSDENTSPWPTDAQNLQTPATVTNSKEEAETEDPCEEKEKDDAEKASLSETSTEKTVNDVQISVKIFKGTKKPIEVDIQTKKLKKNKTRRPEKPKMNDKSQNTSFDNDDIAPLPQINRSTPNNTICAQNPSTLRNSDDTVGDIIQNDAEQEVDDIELIFTTDDTKETDFKEELVPIEPYSDPQHLQCPLSDYDEKGDVSDRELEDDVFNDNFENDNQDCNFQSQTFDFRRENSQIYNSKSDNSINHEDKSLKSYYSYQDSSFENKSLEKDESFDRFEEKVRIVETDISKIGIQDVDYNMGRRNTCPNPLQYRPIMHREALGRGLSSRKCRPILAHSNVNRKESGVQTDISAIPGSSWRSESSLAHKVKVGENFTTLPSKFPHPGSRLRLSEKTVEARRVLLSDIGFTSMVPELSRSADHLCPPNLRAPVQTTYGQFLRTSDLYSPAYTSQKFVWTTATPSEGSHSHSRYSSQYPLSSPPAPTRRCSAPVSPSRRATNLKTAPSRVRFANGSLPELRGDWTTTIDSGESTDSLVEEAEHFLRRSIDCLAPRRDICFRGEETKQTVRRASAPEPSRDNIPPQGWQPFLPRVPRDLHLDYWVKVISPEGRVRGGRVRYVGPLMTQVEQFVGVQLSTPDGHSDGTHNSRRYFNCEPCHGIFVPFKKIIMGWRP